MNLWIFDMAREVMTQLSFEAENPITPVWPPDGKFLVFGSSGALAWIRSDGSGPVERMPVASRFVLPRSFSPDGKWLAFVRDDPQTRADLWTAPVERTADTLQLGHPQVLLRQAGQQFSPAISPDGAGSRTSPTSRRAIKFT